MKNGNEEERRADLDMLSCQIIYVLCVWMLRDTDNGLGWMEEDGREGGRSQVEVLLGMKDPMCA
jgi:hypothetical protein